MRNIKLKQIAQTDTGKVRQANEDNYGYAESPVGQIFTVCDGMGGHVGGAIASKIAVNSILEYLLKVDLTSPSVEINNAIVFANQQILDHVKNNPTLTGMGTTCTVMVVTNVSIKIGHVGDSRIYIFSNNQLFRLTKDHSYVQNLVDSGALTESEAEKHPRKNELTQALGVRSQVEPTINIINIEPKKGDLFLLCSDGLCGYVDDKTISAIISNNPNLELASANLIKAANDVGGFDNITVQLGQVIESPFNESVFDGKLPERENLSSTMRIENKKRFSDNSQIKLIKKIKTEYLIIAVAFSLIVVLVFYYSQWSIKQTTDQPKNKIIVQSLNLDSLNKSKNTLSFNCDSSIIDSLYLSHLVSLHGETYNDILKTHKLKYKPAEIDFSTVYDISKNIIKEPFKIKKGERIMWRRNIKQHKDSANHKNLK